MIDAREWPLLTWLGIALAFCVLQPGLRAGLGQVIGAITPVIVAILIILALWVGGSVLGALHLGLWETGLVGETAFWFVGTALVLMFSVTQGLTDERYFRRQLLGVLGVAVLAELFINLYVFHFAVELLLLPLLVFLAALSVVAGRSEQSRTVKAVVDIALTFIGLALAGYVLFQVVDGWQDIDWTGTLRAFLLPVWLVIAIVPFLYLLRVYVAYDQAFRRIDYESERLGQALRAKLAIVLKLRTQTHIVAALTPYWVRQVAVTDAIGQTFQAIDSFTGDLDEARRAQTAAAERLQRNAGVDGEDEKGRRLDQREFKETKDALRGLATAQMGWHRNRGGRYRSELLEILQPRFERSGLPSDHGISLCVADDGQSWWAYRRTVTGWCFAVGAEGPPPDEWLFDGPEPPTGPPETDPSWGEKWGIDARNW